MTVSVNGTNGLTFNDGSSQNTSPFTGGFGFRNRIINGDCRIDQRNAGASVTVNSAAAFYATDRFRASATSSAGVFTAQQVTDAPTGFVNSLRVTVTTTDSSLAATDLYYVAQAIEGFNVADLGFGASGASPVTISFWVKSSVTGAFGGVLANGSSWDRSYPFSYTISAANTWEQKSVTIAGDTTGTWVKDNNTGMRIVFGLGVGSTFSGTANAWSASQLLSSTGATNLMATSSATWQVTGVQLEKGSTATSFDYRPYGTELALCQRYCMAYGGSNLYEAVGYGFAISTGIVNINTALPVQMRTAPSLSVVGSWQISDGVTGSVIFVLSLLSIQTGLQQVCLNATSSGLTTYRPYRIETANSTASRIFFISEL